MKPGNKVAVQITPFGAMIYATNMVPESINFVPGMSQEQKNKLVDEAKEAYEVKRKAAYEAWIDNFNGVVHIADFWDRSPCMWFCDLSKLDDDDLVQKTYKDAVRKAMKNAQTKDDWYLPGTFTLHGFGGRPDQVKHAVVHPPCNVEASVLIYYP